MDAALQLGAPVRCAGETVGTLVDVVLDPATRRLTHLVVETNQGPVRAVPFELLTPGSVPREVALSCTPEELHALEPIREFAYLRFDEFPAPDADTDVGVEDMQVLPTYDAAEFGGYTGELDSAVGVTYDRIPSGEAELRRSSAVVSSDGHEVGHLDGFLVHDGDVTHVVLERGHLWGTRAVTIPVEAVETIQTDKVTVRLSKDEIGALPSVRRNFPF